MSLHSFEPKIAMKVGLNAAVLFQNLTFWVKKNQTDGRNLFEGRHWTYNSIAAFAQFFPYLTEKQIRTAFDKLENAGLILRGQFSKNKYDRTTWYTFADAISPKGRIEVPETEIEGRAPEGIPNASEGKSIKNSYKPDTKPQPPCPAEVVTEILEQIWLAYPQDRRRNHATCLTCIKDAITEGVLADDLLKAVKEYAIVSSKFTRSRVSFSDNWFKAQHYRSYVDEIRSKRQETDVEMIEGLERVAGWISVRSPKCRLISDNQIAYLRKTGLVSDVQIQAAGLVP